MAEYSNPNTYQEDAVPRGPMSSNTDASLLGPTKHRKNVISWDDYFMSLAILSSQRSKDPSTQVGACIVNKDKRVIGMGYNGLPDGCKDDRFPWGKAAHECCCECGCGCDECQCSKRRKVEYRWLKDKNFYVCHAELNAIVNSYMGIL
ncbi:putative deoxycytidylate deaminase [Clavelina lepadiformis]|uniref:putative deoxycytidylate deaminase n=1 Tax=Clavelina lepadiformis TaxID=159417 RepID=UPI004042A2C9